ncbi:MAG: phospholipase D-like domain-containing protein [Bacteroidales bacterium]|nr:phospholipase D-like domain-containing protein [Bacteroidales bacterium]
MTKIYFSPGHDCLNAITDVLKNAKRSANICVFTISDNRIVDAIKDMQLNGVNIKIISDNDKRYDKGNDIDYIASRLGIDVKLDTTSAHMHHKFAVIDDEITITGSYNWTRSAETRNYENILVTDSKDVAKTYNKEFNKLWQITEQI